MCAIEMVEVKLNVQKQLQYDNVAECERTMFLTPVQESLEELRNVQDSSSDEEKNGCNMDALKIHKMFGFHNIIPLYCQIECSFPWEDFCTNSVIKEETA